jgi:hypothetical protein
VEVIKKRSVGVGIRMRDPGSDAIVDVAEIKTKSELKGR